MKKCSSCGRGTKDFAHFPCAGCDVDIIRCKYCRENRNTFKCSCGFEGP